MLENFLKQIAMVLIQKREGNLIVLIYLLTYKLMTKLIVLKDIPNLYIQNATLKDIDYV